ncbi:ribonuclease [Shinella zoogloeoides]|uniref:Ribonuclease n=1 Tax=Shinella zoogloeoides TaxID=352475 RepID=A0A6N8TER0_SHIZO|nr:ribonuclease [Shinella zoogloeoides]MXO00656.1 ribonuclease [Shinella zoogloeoides]UEX80085.1 ribonuclease [Shinella zoogloeoides]
MKTKAALCFRCLFSFLSACLCLLAAPAFAGTEAAPAGAAREILSVSWQPGYCAARPKSRGCADFSAAGPAAKRFSLHSRFQIRNSYCGVEADLQQRARKGKWTELPEITLASGTRERLLAAMPAARIGLDRRQWLKSGSCLATSAEAYYSRSLDLLDQLNASPLPALFSGKAGGVMTLAEVRAAFDAAFGPGAGERVRLACRKTAGQPVVIGLTIGLAAGEGTLSALIGGAVPVKSRCTEGIAAVAGAR